MSSDYYGAAAGELADVAAEIEAAFDAWLDAHTRRENDCSYLDELRAAFVAGCIAARERGRT